MSAEVSGTVCVFVRSSVNVNTVTVKAGHVELPINLQEIGTVERFLIMSHFSYSFGFFSVITITNI